MGQQKSRFGKFIDKAEEGIIAFLFASMVLVTFTQVVARYVFNSGAVWALELTTYLFAWLVLFGISYGVKKNSHLGVDAFVKLFSNRGQTIFGLIAISACLLYAAIIFYGSYEYLGKLIKFDLPAEDLPIPLWVPMSILPIGLGLLFFRFSQVAYRIITGQQIGFKLGDEAADAMREHLDRAAVEGEQEREEKRKNRS